MQPLAELWWDSSPLVYEHWRRRMIAKAADPGEMTVWLDRLFCDANPPEKNLFRGVTTNPRLTPNAIKDNPAYWSNWIDEAIRADRGADAETIFWKTYKEIARRGAALFLPQFEASRRQYGFFSAQADPRYRHDADRMTAQGIELNGLSPNIMIKIPGTAEGYEAIRADRWWRCCWRLPA